MKLDPYAKHKEHENYRAEKKDLKLSILKDSDGYENKVYMTQVRHIAGLKLFGVSYVITSKFKGIENVEEFYTFSEAVDGYLKLNEFMSL